MAYYERMGVFKDGIPQFETHRAELEKGIGPIPRASGQGRVLEVGGGTSPYCLSLIKAGWVYTGIEPSKWAAEWVRKTYGVTVIESMLQGDVVLEPFDLVFAAHVLEHTDDPYLFLQIFHKLTKPNGQLVLIIPDDTDLCNPDHLYFFNESSIKRILELTGWFVEKFCLQKIVPQENFLYLLARRVENGV